MTGLFTRKRDRALAPRRYSHPATRGLFAGLIVGALMVAAVAVGVAPGLLTQPRATAQDSSPAPTVVVFSSRGEDGASIAAFTLVVGPDGRSSLLDPSASVSVPGVSATTVREASAFVGARGLAAALGNRSPRHFAEYDESAWLAALVRRGPVRVDVPRPLDTFDGRRVHSFPAGMQTVAPEDVAHLANGAQFLAPADRAALLERLASTVLAAVAATGSPAPAATDMSPAGLDLVLDAAAANDAGPRLSALPEGVR